MSEFAVENRSTTPKNFFAGEFPTVPESGKAGAAIKEYAPVKLDTDGNVVTIAAKTDKILGIAAAAAEKDEPVVYYMTGEFFADALNMPTGVTAADIKDACRQISIFLK